MNRLTVRLLWLIMVVSTGGIIYASYAADEARLTQALPTKLREPLTIHTSRGEYHFKVEVVKEPEEMRKGLMFREEVPENTGMLFEFAATRRISMWMKNTLVPLDMIFIDASGTVVDIAENTEPFSMEIITAKHPAMAVLEVAAGTSNHYGIRPGDKVKHPLFESKGR